MPYYSMIFNISFPFSIDPDDDDDDDDLDNLATFPEPIDLPDDFKLEAVNGLILYTLCCRLPDIGPYIYI